MLKKFALGLAIVAVIGCGNSQSFVVTSPPPAPEPAIPAEIAAIFNKPIYDGAIWGLRVLDADTGEVLLDNTQPGYEFFIASVRKSFSSGALLEALGGDHSYDTPVFRQGEVDDAGVLDGDLVLVASGDLTMQGRRGPDGRIQFTDYDHNEANSLGNAVLTTADPLLGYKTLAAQVADAGITRVTGDVVVDDRLFQPYLFRDEFLMTPAFVNDDVVDLTISPTTPGNLAEVAVRPLSSAFTVVSSLLTSAAGTELTLELDPEVPPNIGTPGATGEVLGDLPVDFVPALTGDFPLVQTFRISSPSNYARTVFVEALEAEGVVVDADTVKANPVGLLPAEGSYLPVERLALLTGSPVADVVRYVMKVSYNIGADTTLLLFGLTRGVDDMDAALLAEQQYLSTEVGIDPSTYHFIDGSGGGDTTATLPTVTTMLDYLIDSPVAEDFLASMPILAVDGSLGFVKNFMADPTLAGAAGKVYAKSGSYVGLVDGEVQIKCQAFAGYIDAKSGRRLTYAVLVNGVATEDVVTDITGIFQDEGTISAILWRDF